MFTLKELTTLRDALTMLAKSNERMRASKPLYASIFDAMAIEINEIGDKLRKLSVVDVDKTNKPK